MTALHTRRQLRLENLAGILFVCLEHAITWLCISTFASSTIDGLHRQKNRDISKETLVCEKTKVKAQKKGFFFCSFLSRQSVLTLTWRQQNRWNRWNLLRLLRWTQRLSRQHQSCQSWIWELRVVENSLSEMSLRVKKVRVAFIQTFQQWANYD